MPRRLHDSGEISAVGIEADRDQEESQYRHDQQESAIAVHDDRAIALMSS